ncbi:uncharacterized protein ANIA_11475 [Aspergillus nidulans FGSC A4]|uniref:Uncharacterized protein n=1 Tax=Emericella nidulans (strain FGSC A4 / ATCC 38163 / CBS 112.46 / NRRL 194 / M139) TaxID=227321 RepID=C8VGW6_EMENI|nr:hypothetical protein [Aspergillus nidulans FGSC A4]CBF82120.1 TPA: hypothetical protein ANIA_11475 [Aspergillus nidulans FGSC A4]
MILLTLLIRPISPAEPSEPSQIPGLIVICGPPDFPRVNVFPIYVVSRLASSATDSFYSE